MSVKYEFDTQSLVTSFGEYIDIAENQEAARLAVSGNDKHSFFFCF